MRGVAIADVHLGFPGAGRMVGGRPQREVDVETAWAAAVENAIRFGPDLVTIAGDVFHHPRVSTHAVKAFRDGVHRLVDAGIRVVIAQGNHDAAKTAGTLSPLHIPDDYPGVFVVTTPSRIKFTCERTGERVAVAVFPYVSMGSGELYRMEPDPSRDVNVLLVHAAVRGDASGDQLPHFYGADAAAIDVAREAERWSVVALGDFHEFRRLHPTAPAFYSGSIERTSSNIWAEPGPKGIVGFDTATGELEFIEHPTRPMFDLDAATAPALDCALSGAEEVNYCLQLLAADSAVADALVRLQVHGFPREERDQVDWALVRELKGRCTLFLLDIEYAAGGLAGAADRRTAPRRTLEDEAEARLEGNEPAVRGAVLSLLAATAAEAAAEEEVALVA